MTWISSASGEWVTHAEAEERPPLETGHVTPRSPAACCLTQPAPVICETCTLLPSGLVHEVRASPEKRPQVEAELDTAWDPKLPGREGCGHLRPPLPQGSLWSVKMIWQ